MAGFNLVQKGRAGDAIIVRWTMTMMTTMTMARGGSKGKSINDSVLCSLSYWWPQKFSRKYLNYPYILLRSAPTPPIILMFFWRNR